MVGRGVVRNGLIYPREDLLSLEGQEVTYTIAESSLTSEGLDDERAAFLRFLQTNSADFDVTDLAENHDYYRRNPPQGD